MPAFLQPVLWLSLSDVKNIMSRRDDDHIGHVPKIAPAHDEVASYQRIQGKGSLKARLGEVPDVQGGGGGSPISTGVLGLVIVVLLATAGLSGYLYQKLTQAEQSIQNYELRISDLERRLSVTDESMSESSVAMKVKVQELDSEIRKLWDNVWKKTSATLSQHEALLKNHQQSISKNESFINSTKERLSKNDAVLSGLNTQLAKAEKIQSLVDASQRKMAQQETRIDTAVDKLNLMSTNVTKLESRVKDTEGWIESINAFRRQVNQDINNLKQGTGQAQGG
jgi:hypothetical protein